MSLRIEEYKMLREKSLDAIKRMDQLERDVIISCGAIFVFSVSSFKPADSYSRALIMFLPFLISLLGYFRYKGLSLYLKTVNAYTAKIEPELFGGTGWLTYYYSELLQHKRADKWDNYRRIIWYSIMVFNLLAGSWIVLFTRF